MPTKPKPVTAVVEQEEETPTANPFANEIAAARSEMSAGGSGGVQYLKPGKMVFKLVLADEGPKTLANSYRKIRTAFKKGNEVKPGTAVIVRAVIVEADADGVADKEKVRYVKFPKSVFDGVLQNLEDGWNVYAEPGPLVSVDNNKSRKPQYSVTVLPKKFNASLAEYPETSIEDAQIAQNALADAVLNGGSTPSNDEGEPLA